MERLTYDFALGGNHCWQVKGADNLECREVCERQGDGGCKTCPIAKAFDRLAAIEDILGNEYDLDRLRELVEADREGLCVVFPCKPGDTVYQFTPSICKWRETNKCDRCPGYGACWEGTTIIEPVQFEPDMIDSVGTDIFLTRAEAEEALRREQE